MHFEEGFHLVVNRDFPTFTLIEPEIRKLVESGDFGQKLRIYIQDDPSYLSDLSQSVSDASLESSYRLKIEIVPALIRFENGEETSRSIGWVRKEWSQLFKEPMFGEHLPESRPGCGSLTVIPGVKETLDARFGDLPLNSRTTDSWLFVQEDLQDYFQGS